MPASQGSLEIVEGPGSGRRFVLPNGQINYVGRTSQADISCPENETMSSVYFSIRQIDGAFDLKDLNSANGTWYQMGRREACSGKVAF